MSDFYVDSVYGNDSNIGSAQAPFASLTRALLEANTDNCNIFLAEGTYFGGEYQVTNSGTHIIGVGNVVLDCLGFTHAFYFAITQIHQIVLKNLRITGFSSYLMQHLDGWSNLLPPFDEDPDNVTLVACTVYAKGVLHNLVHLFGELTPYRWRGKYKFYNCTFFGILMSLASGSNDNDQVPMGHWHHSVVESGVSNDFEYLHYYVDNCASNDINFQDNNGFDTDEITGSPPPFLSNSTESPDLKYDPGHPQFTKYSKGGEFNRHIGHFSRPVISWLKTTFGNNPPVDALQSLTNNRIYGSFENDLNTYNPSWIDVEVQVGVNDSLDFDEGAGELTAVVAPGVYVDGDSLALAILNAINLVATDTFSVTFSATSRIVVASDGSQLSLPWSTGTNSTTSIGDLIGFNVVSDDLGQNLYGADYVLNGGGLAGSTAISLGDGVAVLDLNLEPLATFGACVSPVIDNATPKELIRVYVTFQNSGTGEIDTDTSAPRTIEVRGSNTNFDTQDPSGVTPLDWTEIERDGLETVSHTYRYLQIRITLRIDAV